MIQIWGNASEKDIQKRNSKRQKKWSCVEKETIKLYYELNMPLSEISVKMKRSINSIQGMASLMNITRCKKWGEKDELFLKENYKKMSLKELGAHFGKSRGAIHGKIERMGLKR